MDMYVYLDIFLYVENYRVHEHETGFKIIGIKK